MPLSRTCAVAAFAKPVRASLDRKRQFYRSLPAPAPSNPPQARLDTADVMDQQHRIDTSATNVSRSWNRFADRMRVEHADVPVTVGADVRAGSPKPIPAELEVARLGAFVAHEQQSNLAVPIYSK